MPGLDETIEKSIKQEGLPLIREGKTNLPLYVSLRELPLRFHLGTSRIQKFFDGLKEGKIYMTQCKECGENFFPPQADCPKCPKSSMNWIALSGEGELLTCTMIFVKPTTYSHYDHYVVGIAQMKEGVRVLAWLNIEDPQKIEPRMKVQLTTVRREPEGFITYQFLPASTK